MQKLVYVLLGLLMCAGAFGLLGLRTSGARDGTGISRYWSDRGGGLRAPRPQIELGPTARSAFEFERGRGGSARAWKLVQMVLDGLNVLVGIIGIGLTVIGLRVQRPTKTIEKADG